jgi:hypothetical protein
MGADRARRLQVTGRPARAAAPGPAAVTYADAAGVQRLRDLAGEGVDITGCSSFVGELLRPGGP